MSLLRGNTTTTVNLKNLAPLLQKLKKMQTSLASEAVSTGIKAGADYLQKRIAAQAPIDTGKLRKWIVAMPETTDFNYMSIKVELPDPSVARLINTADVLTVTLRAVLLPFSTISVVFAFPAVPAVPHRITKIPSPEPIDLLALVPAPTPPSPLCNRVPNPLVPCVAAIYYN